MQAWLGRLVASSQSRRHQECVAKLRAENRQVGSPAPPRVSSSVLAFFRRSLEARRRRRGRCGWFPLICSELAAKGALPEPRPLVTGGRAGWVHVWASVAREIGGTGGHNQERRCPVLFASLCYASICSFASSQTFETPVAGWGRCAFCSERSLSLRLQPFEGRTEDFAG